MRTWPPAFPKKLVASLAGKWSPWTCHLARSSGKPCWQKQKSWNLLKALDALACPVTVWHPRGPDRHSGRLSSHSEGPSSGTRAQTIPDPRAGNGKHSCLGYSLGIGIQSQDTGRTFIPNRGRWCLGPRVATRTAGLGGPCPSWRATSYLRSTRQRGASPEAGLFPGDHYLSPQAG